MSIDTLAGMRKVTNQRDELTVALFNQMPVNDKLEFLYRIAMTTDRGLQVALGQPDQGALDALAEHVHMIEASVAKLSRMLDNDVQRIDSAVRDIGYEIDQLKRGRN